MKLLNTDRKEGYAKIQIENNDDLWYLKELIDKGDQVRTKTQRTKLDGREKKTVTLTIEVEKTEYQKDRLRVTGEIVKGADDIELGYHTFNLEAGTEFEMWKEFTDAEWEQLQEAQRKESYEVLFCLVEKGSCDIYRVEESGITDLSKVRDNVPGKMYSHDETGEGFHKEVASILERSDAENIVLAGPGFQKKKVYNELSDETQKKVNLQDTSVTGKTGLHEAIKRGALEKIVDESRISEESSLIEEFLKRLEQEGKVSYGEPVKDLAEMGAVKKLLITPEKLRENRKIAEKVEQQGGEVKTIHTDNEPGMRLEQFGGIAAFLRYKPS